VSYEFEFSSQGWGLERAGDKKEKGGERSRILWPHFRFWITQTHVVQSKKAQLLHSWVFVGPTPTSYNTFQHPLWTFKKIRFFDPSPKKNVTKCMQILRSHRSKNDHFFHSTLIDTKPEEQYVTEHLSGISLLLKRWTHRIPSCVSCTEDVKKQGVSKIGLFRPYRLDPTIFPGENPHMEKTLFWYNTDALPLTLTSQKIKDPKVSLALHALGAENGSREGPPSKILLSDPGRPPGPRMSLFSWYTHTCSGP